MIITSGLWETQVGIVTALRGYAPLMARVTAVLDEVDNDAVLPYIALNSDTSVDDSNKTFGAEEITTSLSVWSEYKGKKEVKQIIALITQAITRAPLTMPLGFSIGTTIREYANVFKESDTVYHGVVRFRFTVNQI